MGITYQIDKCPVCKTTCRSGICDHKEKKEVNCERCGKYKVFLLGLNSSEIDKYKDGYAILSYYIKNFYDPQELLDEEKINSILENNQLPIYENKYKTLLLWLANESGYSTKSILGNSNNLASIIGAVDGNEVIEILDDIWAERLIVVEQPSGDSLRKFGPLLGFKVHLAPNGIKKAKEIIEKNDLSSLSSIQNKSNHITKNSSAIDKTVNQVDGRGYKVHMMKIKLTLAEWEYDENKTLGKPGGFGKVYEGRNNKGKIVAVKRLYSDRLNLINRELRIASELLNKNYENVLCYYDYGKDINSNDYYLVMPRATKNLDEEIEEKIKIVELDSIKILLQILNGLKEINTLVHRDLKPANILLADDKWKIADLGIAKFIEESTSMNTLKNFLSAPFAAPEQWNLLPSTKATDIYALGCIGFCLLTGKPPFAGGDQQEYKNNHLNSAPKRIPGISDKLNSILLILLRKNPESRPTLDRTIEMLSKLIEKRDPNQGSTKELEKIGAMEVERIGEEEALLNENQNEYNRKFKLLIEAKDILLKIKDVLFQKIEDGAPSLKISSDINYKYTSYRVELGEANLILQISNINNVMESSPLERSGWDVINIANISVVQSKVGSEYVWSANLLYTDSGKNKSSYRWTELLFMTQPLMSSRQEYEPFALHSLKDIDKAIAPGINEYQLAASPKFIDDEDIDSFCDRWLNLFVKAYKGELRIPSSLPLS